MDQENSVVLFLCSANDEQLQFIEGFFNSESSKMELIWGARARSQSTFRESVDLAGVKLVVIVSPGDLRNSLNDLLKKHSAKVEYWQWAPGTDLEALIQSELKRLFVRLVLQGGKRKGGESALQARCSTCLNPTAHCSCPKNVIASTAQKAKPVVKIALERKGRRGKDVTVVSGLPGELDLDELATRLKKVCGSGGTVKDATIEIQGDHRERLTTELESKGYKCKRVGG